jgi:hypothetical protein
MAKAEAEAERVKALTKIETDDLLDRARRRMEK